MLVDMVYICMVGINKSLGQFPVKRVCLENMHEDGIAIVVFLVDRR